MKYKLINTYDVTNIINNLSKIKNWNYVDKNYESISGINDNALFKNDLVDIVKDAKKFCKKENILQSTIAKADSQYIGTTHADYDNFNKQNNEKILERNISGYGIFRFILFIQAENIVLEVDKEKINVNSGDFFWLDHYQPHNIYNYGNKLRYQIMMDFN